MEYDNYWILDENKNTIKVPFDEYVKYNKEYKDNHIADDIFGGIRISTIFLGINHDWHGGVLLFETMVFDNRDDNNVPFPNFPYEYYCMRYRLYKEAELGHGKVVDMVKRWLATGVDESENE